VDAYAAYKALAEPAPEGGPVTLTLSRLINRHPARQIDQLMPWAYANPVA